MVRVLVLTHVEVGGQLALVIAPTILVVRYVFSVSSANFGPQHLLMCSKDARIHGGFSAVLKPGRALQGRVLGQLLGFSIAQSKN